MRRKIFKLFISICLVVFSANLSYSYQRYSDLTKNITLPVSQKAYKSLRARPMLVNKLKQQSQNMSDNDKNIISKYVNGAVKGEKTFLYINGYLRGNLNAYLKLKDITNPFKCRLQYYADSLSSVLSAQRLSQNVILYKALDDCDLKTLLNDKIALSLFNKPVTNDTLIALKARLNNVVFEEKGFLLSTYDKNCLDNTKFVLKIHAPKNLQAVLIDDIRNNNKKEVLINSGYCWKIFDISSESNKNVNNYVISIKLELTP